jgi:5'-nucleotidase
VSASSRSRRLSTATAISGLVAAPLAVVGLAAPASAADPVDITILGTNDFHGRLLPDRGIPGAAKYAGAVEALRAQNPNTVFAAAGDLIGATTFESFIAQDKPTIDVLNEMELDVSAVGNHELDQGYEDLTQRVMQPETEANPNGGAEWEYVAANLDEPGTADLIPPSYTQDVAGVTVGFVGAVTEHLSELVSPAGIQGVTVQDIVAATNAEADSLKAAGADVVVMLVHEGAPSTDCAAMDDDAASDFGSIVTGVNANVDAIISGHTHLPYSCEMPAPGGQSRWVVSAGQYGSHLNKLDFQVDPANGEIASVASELIDVNAGSYTADPEVTAIVEAAKAAAEGPGAEELGQIAHPFQRAKKVDGAENRGAESTLGNLVAEVQRWATSEETFGGAQIAFMNPGGLRADMAGNAAEGYPAPLTYRQAANVQPFANTLVNMRLTGEQIRRVLEEQWQPAGASRPFLRLGTSEGFEYTYDPDAAAGSRVQDMWLNGEPIADEQSYSVTANSFLAAGGDSFTTFAEGTARRDTGQTDLQAMVAYMAQHGEADPVESTWDQQAVGLDWITDDVVRPGDTRIAFDLSSLSFTAPGDLQDTRVVVRLGDLVLGRFAVDNTLVPLTDPLSAFDETGAASVDVNVPPRFKGQEAELQVIGNNTGTTIVVPVRVTRR